MTKRRRGRPSLGERVPLGLRVTPEIKRRLDEAAKRSGRSQSQEAEFRLERSFDRHDLLPDVLRLQYGRDLAGVLMLLGNAMIWADAFHRVDDKPKLKRQGSKPWQWAHDADSYDAAVAAAQTILEALRPRQPTTSQQGREAGREVASHLLVAVRDGTSTGLADDADIEAIRSFLGPRLRHINPAFADRLNQGKPREDKEQ